MCYQISDNDNITDHGLSKIFTGQISPADLTTYTRLMQSTNQWDNIYNQNTQHFKEITYEANEILL